jgi:hypothetical protein
MQASLIAMEREESGNAESSSDTGSTGPAASGDAASGQFAGKRIAVLQATKQDAVNIPERDRSLGGRPMHQRAGKSCLTASDSAGACRCFSMVEAGSSQVDSPEI